MIFLQFAVWGGWLISLGGYLGGVLSFTGIQIGSFYATMGIASLFMPGLMGIIADKWIPAQKLLGICHFLGGCFLLLAASQTEYATLYPMILLAVIFYMPTIALSNSVAFTALEKNGLEPVKTFPPIRVFGTVGFICSMIAVDLVSINGVKLTASSYQLYFSAVLAFLLAFYSFTLPTCPVSSSKKSSSWIEALGLRAFTLFKKRKMAIFFIFAMLLGFALQITNMFANPYLSNHFGNAELFPQYQDTFGVKHANILISLSQISETFCILLIPFFLRRFGIKKVMLISMLAWVFRFGLLGAGDPGAGVWMLILSMIVYGVAFDFFNISGALFVEKETDISIRSSAQGVFMIMTNGFGAFFGSYIAGAVVQKIGWPHSWYIFAVYALAVTIVFSFVFKYKHEVKDEIRLIR